MTRRRRLAGSDNQRGKKLRSDGGNCRRVHGFETLEARQMLSASNEFGPLPAEIIRPAIVQTFFSETNATTTENTQTSSGLVIEYARSDNAVSFQITNITGGSLFLNDGVTPVTDGEFIPVADGANGSTNPAAGLTFTPANGSLGGFFDVQESTTMDASGLLGPTLTAAISVTLPSTSSFTWTGDGNGTSWSDPNNWSPQQVPTAGANVLINTAANVVYDSSAGSSTITSVTLDNGASLAITGGALTVDGDVAFDDTAVISGLTTLTGGTLQDTAGAGGTLSNTVFNMPAGAVMGITGGTYSNTTFDMPSPAVVEIGTSGSELEGLSFGDPIPYGIIAGFGGTSGTPVFTGNTVSDTSAGATVQWNGGTFSGTFTGTGAGTVQLDPPSTTLGAGGLTLNCPGSMFQWVDGILYAGNGNLTNLGTINLVSSFPKDFYNDGTLDNYGTIAQSGTGNLYLGTDNTFPSILMNEAGASYLLESSGGIGETEDFIGTTAVPEILNSGTILKTTADSNTSTFNISDGILSNSGTIEADAGTLDLGLATLNQFSAGTLTGGTWNAINGATLQLPSAANVYSNDANITLSGAGATITGIGNMDANNGSFTLASGATFTTAAQFTNNGTLTLGTSATAGSVLTVASDFFQDSQGTIVEQIGGSSASLLFGRLSAGFVNLEGAFNVTMANGYQATSGDSYQVMTFSSGIGDLGSFGQTGSAFTEVFNATNLTLDVAVSQCDLAVDSVTATASAAVVGQDITVDWQVTNDSSNPANGNWQDSVYISSTPTITGGAALLGTVVHTGGLGADDSYASDASLTAALPTLLPGNYYILVETDSLYQVPDANRANNVLATASPIAVTLPSLTLGTATASSFTATGQSQYYQVTVPAGGSMIVALASSASSGATALYVNQGSLPSPSNYEVASNTANQPNQTAIVPQVLTAGTYYILAKSVSGAAATAAYTLTATQTTAVSVASIFPQSAANGGDATVQISGTNFLPTATAALVPTTGPSIAATSVTYVSPTLLYATFNLASAQAAAYTLQVTQGAATSGASFQVLPSTFNEVAGVSQQASVTPITFGESVPQYVRSGGTGTVVITYTNNTGNDVVAPLLDIQSSNSFVTFSTPDDPNLFRSSAQLLAVAPSGPAGVLAPGQSGEITLTFKSSDTTNDDSLPLLVSELSNTSAQNATIDWAGLETALQPANESAAAWNVSYQNLENILGTTSNSYNTALAQAATYLASVGEGTAQVSDVNSLWSFLLAQADADFPTTTLVSTVDASLPTPGSLSLSLDRSFASNIAGRYEPGIFGLGWTSSWQGTLSTDNSGDVTLDVGGTTSYFAEQSNGTYAAVDGELGTLTNSAGLYTFTTAAGTQYAFSNGLLQYEQDNNGNRITLGYNGQNQLVTLTYSNSGDLSEPTEGLSLSYNGQGFVSEVTDGIGDDWTYSYDSAGHLLSVNAPGPTVAGLTTTYTYGSAGASDNALESITSPDGSEQTYSYDSEGRLSSSSSNDGTTTQFSYLGEGEVETTVVGAGSTITWFDANGQPARIQNALGGVSSYAYDENGDEIQYTNAEGDTYDYGYNSRGDLVSEVDPLGQLETMTYNGLSEVTSLTAGGNTTQYSYSSVGNLLSISYPDGTQQSFTYNPLGSVSQAIDQEGNPTSYQYNNLGLATEETFADGTYEIFGYDSHGNMLTAETYDAIGNPTGTTTMAYNGANEMTSVAYSNGLTLTYSYNATGQRTQSVDQTGYTLTYSYNSIGQLTGLSDGLGMVVTYTYNSLGQLTEKQNASGTYTTYGYDADGNLTGEINYQNSSTVNSSFAYAYNALNEMTSMTDADGNVTSYGYNPLGELQTVSLPGGGSISYTYNAAGDRTQVVNTGDTTTYASNSTNEITQAGSTTYQYNADGDLAAAVDADGTTAYAYNDLNQLISITTPDGTVTTFQYSPLGTLSSESVNGVQTNYLVDPTSSSAVSSYDASNNLIAHYNYGLGLVSQTGPSGTGYYDFDIAGNTVGISGSSGNYVNQYSYLPFGTATALSDTLPNPFTFDGQNGALQVSSNLYNMRARDYTPDTGQFLTNDPVNLAGDGSNLRMYAENDPTQATDPTGLGGYPAELWGKSLPQVMEGGAADAAAYESQYVAANTISAAEGLSVVAQGAATLPASEFCASAGVSLGGTVAGVATVGFAAGYGIGSAINWGLGQFQAGQQFQQNLGNTLYGAYQKVFGGPELAEKQEAEQEFQQRNIKNGAPPQVNDPEDTPSAPFYTPFNPIQSPPPVTNQTAQDPNALIGPAGYSTPNFIQDAGNLGYTIDFANDGSVAAQVVTVTEQLNSNLDWSTFQFGAFGFGSVNITVPIGLYQYQTTVSYQNLDGSSLNVLVSLMFSVATGQLMATFTSLDPLTGQAPTGVTDGFLPPDNSSGIGEGYVQYTVQPKSGLTTGTTITGQAAVVFDINAPLDTESVSNTIDAVAPTSSVSTLPATESSTSFNVSWSGSDDAEGSGIAYYNIYVSDDGGAYTLFQSQTTNTSATFTGQNGHTYKFYSIAVDNVGNVEGVPSSPQATTTVSISTQSAPTLTLTDNSGPYTASAYAATAKVNGQSSLENVTPTLSYYSGTAASGTILSGAPSTVGTYTVLASYSGSTDYTTAATSVTFSITQVAPSLTVSDNGGTYTSSPFSASDSVAGVGSQSSPASSLESLSPTLTYYSGTAASGTALSGVPSTVGTYTVLASFIGSTDYGTASASKTFSITKATATVTATDNSGTYTGSQFTASDSVAGVGSQSSPASSLESVSPTLTYYSGTAASGTALSGVPSTVGTYTVLASFIGSTDYGTASASKTFSITKATATVTATDNSGTYTSSQFAAADSVAGVGSQSSPASNLESVSPTLTYYSGTAASGTVLSGAPSTVGTYTVLASFAGSTDYGTASASKTFSITKATAAVTATDNGGTYTSSQFTASDSVAGVGSQSSPASSLEGVSPTLTYYSGTAASGTALSGAPSTVGTYTVLASFLGSTDYATASASKTFSITKATATVTAAESSGPYTSSPFTATDSVAGVGSQSTATSSLEGTTPTSIYYSGTAVSGTALSGAPSTVGTYTVVASFAASTDYTSAVSTSITFSITRVTPTVTTTDTSATYTSFAFNATDKVAGVGSQSAAASNLEGVTPTSLYYSGTAASGTALSGAPSGLGTYTVVASFAGSTDYTSAVSTAVTFSITQATPTVKVTDSGGIANGSTTFPASDTVAGAGSQSTAASSLEGVTPTLTYYSGTAVTGSPLSGAPSAAGTYAVLASFAGSTDYTSAEASTTFTIAPAATSTTINFQSLSVSSTILTEPLVLDGFAFTSSGTSAGHALVIEGTSGTPWPGNWPSNVLFADYWGTTINFARSGGGTFTLNSLDLGAYIQADSAIVQGYNAAGTVIDTQVVNFTYPGNAQNASDLLTLGWTGLSKVNVSWWQNSGGTGAARFGAIENLNVQSTSLVTPTLSVTDNGGLYTGGAYPATATVDGLSSLEGVTPTLTYYSGTAASGTALSGAPSAAGTYSVLASFAGSADYTSAAASTTFTISSAATVITFQDLPVSSTILSEPLFENGFAFTSAGTSAGAGLTIEGTSSTPWPGNWPSNVLFANYWGTTINVARYGSGTFTMTGLTVDAYIQAASAIVTGYNASGTAIDTQVVNFTYTGNAQNASDVLTMDWTGLSRVNISWWQDSGGTGAARFGAIDNLILVPSAVSAPTLTLTDNGGAYTGSPYPATVTINGSSSLEGVTPTLVYYPGNKASGTALSAVPSTAGTYSVVASFAGSTDYTSVASTKTFTIAKATPIVTVADAGGTANGSTTFPATDTVNNGASLEGLTPSLTYYSGTAASGSPATGAPSAAGTYTVLASFAGSTDYTSAEASTTFTISSASSNTIINFENLSVSSTILSEPLVESGFAFTSSGTSAGHALVIEGTGSTPWPGNWPSNVLFADYWGTTINVARSGGGTFTLNSLNVDAYIQADSAIVRGYNAAGTVIDTQVVNFTYPGNAQNASALLTLDWSGLSKVNISWWQNTNGTGAARFGAIDNLNLSATTTAPSTKPAATDSGSSSSSTPWQNPTNPLDVLGQGGQVTPQDALEIIDYLDTNPAGTSLPAVHPAGAPYLDVLGQNTVVPQDALDIIDYLNSNPVSPTVASPAVTPAVVAAPAVASDPVAGTASQSGSPVSSSASIAVDLAPNPAGAGALSVTPALMAVNSLPSGGGGATSVSASPTLPPESSATPRSSSTLSPAGLEASATDALFANESTDWWTN